jgi:hypothetical protein
MRIFEYICRCGKRHESLFQQKHHAKYMCWLKHVPLETTENSVRIIEPANNKDMK